MSCGVIVGVGMDGFARWISKHRGEAEGWDLYPRAKDLGEDQEPELQTGRRTRELFEKRRP